MKTILTAIVASMCGSIVTLVISFIFLNRNGFLVGNDCDVFGNVYACYITESAAWGDAAYLQTITTFYGLIITLLVAAATISAAIGAYTIKSSTRNQIEAEIPKCIDDYFEKVSSVELLERTVSRVVDRELSERLKSLSRPESGELLRDLQYVEQRIDELSIQVEKLME